MFRHRLDTAKGQVLLTVKDRMEEKKVPSSYLESLDRRPSRTAANYRGKTLSQTPWVVRLQMCKRQPQHLYKGGIM